MLLDAAVVPYPQRRFVATFATFAPALFPSELELLPAFLVAALTAVLAGIFATFLGLALTGAAFGAAVFAGRFVVAVGGEAGFFSAALAGALPAALMTVLGAVLAGVAGERFEEADFTGATLAAAAVAFFAGAGAAAVFNG